MNKIHLRKLLKNTTLHFSFHKLLKKLDQIRGHLCGVAISGDVRRRAIGDVLFVGSIV